MQFHKDGTMPVRTSDVFVFGSNLAGIHGAGAAKIARNVYGYPLGKAFGLHTDGNINESFGIPTKDNYIQTLPIDTIKSYVEVTKNFILGNPSKMFFFTRIGCGLAGYQDSEIAPLFKGFPDNCSFAEQWIEYL